MSLKKKCSLWPIRYGAMVTDRTRNGLINFFFIYRLCTAVDKAYPFYAAGADEP